MPSWWPRESKWLRRQPPSVLRLHLEAITWLDLQPAEFLTVQAWVNARLAANGHS